VTVAPVDALEPHGGPLLEPGRELVGKPGGHARHGTWVVVAGVQYTQEVRPQFAGHLPDFIQKKCVRWF